MQMQRTVNIPRTHFFIALSSENQKELFRDVVVLLGGLLGGIKRCKNYTTAELVVIRVNSDSNESSDLKLNLF